MLSRLAVMKGKKPFINKEKKYVLLSPLEGLKEKSGIVSDSHAIIHFPYTDKSFSSRSPKLALEYSIRKDNISGSLGL